MDTDINAQKEPHKPINPFGKKIGENRQGPELGEGFSGFLTSKLQFLKEKNAKLDLIKTLKVFLCERPC